MMRAMGMVVLGVVLVSAGAAQGYTLEFVSYTEGAAGASGSITRVSDSDSGLYSASVSASDEQYFESFSASAENADLTSGGGSGEGTYQLAYSTSRASTSYGSAHANAAATYTWRLLSEYGNTGTITLEFSSDGYMTEGATNWGWGSAELRIVTATETWVAAPTWEYSGWDEPSILLDVPIGSTFSVLLNTAAGASYDTISPGNARCGASVNLPVEVPEPTSMVMLLLGGVFVTRRAMRRA